MRLHQLVRAYGGWPDIVQDVHIYGGGLVVAAGITIWSSLGIGIAFFGGLMIYLGLRH